MQLVTEGFPEEVTLVLRSSGYAKFTGQKRERNILSREEHPVEMTQDRGGMSGWEALKED